MFIFGVALAAAATLTAPTVGLQVENLSKNTALGQFDALRPGFELETKLVEEPLGINRFDILAQQEIDDEDVKANATIVLWGVFWFFFYAILLCMLSCCGCIEVKCKGDCDRWHECFDGDCGCCALSSMASFISALY